MLEKFTLIGESSVVSLQRLKRYCQFCVPKGVTRKIHVEVSDVVFDDDLETGERTHSPGVEWDGTCIPEDAIVQVMLSPSATFPMINWVNESLVGNYIRGMYLKDPEEFFIYYLSHEMRHVWQEGRRRSEYLGGRLGGDDETDADLYAILKLSEWRREKS